MKIIDILPARNRSHWQPAKVNFNPREPKSLITFEFAHKIQAKGLNNYTPPALNRRGLETSVEFELLLGEKIKKFAAIVVPSIRKADIVIGGDSITGIEVIFKD